MEILDAQIGQAVELSPLFHYWLARTDRETPSLLDPRVALRTAVAEGLCRRELHDPPYDEGGARAQPSDEAREDATTHRLVDFDRRTSRRLYSVITGDPVENGRQALARGFPILVAMWMTSAYKALQKTRRHAPTPPEPSKEGHAVVALGYNDELEAFLIKDSRGMDFGRGGFWEMPYSVMQTRIIHEAWVLQRINYDT
jgi:hypothetical protein